VGTLGVAIALLLGAAWMRTRRAVVPLAAFVLIALLGLSALTVRQPVRADHVVYGRYVDGGLAALLAIALAVVVLRARTRWAALAGVGAAAIVVGAIAVWRREPALLRADNNPINVLATYPLFRAFDRVAPLQWAAIALAGWCAVVAAVRRHALIALAVLAAVFAASAISTDVRYFGDGSDGRYDQSAFARSLPSVIEEAGADDDCIAADTRDETPNDFWERSNVALFSGVEVREWDGAVDLAGCRLALSRHDLTRELAADELGREAATGTALYRLP
jgi:hypothetical protein